MKYHIDGSNIGRLAKQKEEVILLEVVLSLCHHILSEGDDFLCHFDANARYLLEEDKKPIFEQLINSERFKSAPPKNRADQYILDDATDDVLNGMEVKIISNDLYRDFLDPKDPRYKPEYSQYSWVDPLKGTHHTGSVSRGKNGRTLKILSLGFKIPIEEDVNKILPFIIPNVISKEPKKTSSESTTNHVSNNYTEAKTSPNSEPKKTIERKDTYQTPTYDRQDYKTDDEAEIYKLIAKILGPIIFLIFLISYCSGEKKVIPPSNNNNYTPTQSNSNYSTPSHNHNEVKSKPEVKSNNNENYESEPHSTPNICSNCGGSGTTQISESYPCNICNGTGKKQCYNCDPIVCPNCKAVGSKICANCNGNGYRQCGNCNSNGYIQHYAYQEKCGSCDGNGSIKCSNCQGNGNFSCSNCKGTGTVTNPNTANKPCDKCYGSKVLTQTKQLTCSYCNGKGTL